MSGSAVRIDVPLIHGMIVLFLAISSVGYGILFSEMLLGVPVIWLAVSLYVSYLLYRVVLAVERIAYE